MAILETIQPYTKKFTQAILKILLPKCVDKSHTHTHTHIYIYIYIYIYI